MGSSAFALAVALSSIVMYDAAGVRRHAGGPGTRGGGEGLGGVGGLQWCWSRVR
jgi:hypothetical protein